MRAGLLICDHVNEDIQVHYGDYSSMFAMLFPEFSWTFYDCVNYDFPKYPFECDVFFISGSRYSVNNKLPWLNKLKRCIRKIKESDLYLIGFCFGHQLIGSVFGGQVKKSDKGWCAGMYSFQIVLQQKWMKPYKESINVLMMCQDQLFRLPNGAVTLAENVDCPNGIFMMGDKILGIQGHPEFSKQYNKALIELRINTIGNSKSKIAIKSLNKNNDNQLLKEWVTLFIRY